MRATVYLRISEDRTGKEAGVSRQRDDCRRRAAERGWEIVAEHVDNDMSATRSKRRPGFDAMLADVAEGRADVVLAWALDRLQRSRRDELRLYELCRERGAKLSLINGADLDFATASGRFVADSLGSVARLEVEMKSDRQRRAYEQAAAEGRRVGGRRPFGYEADGVTVREDEAAAVRRGFADVLAGVPLAAIARSWNEAGFRTGQTGWKGERRGQPSPWTHSSVRAVLTNPRYAGKRAHRGQIIADAVWPALVPEETWRAAVAVLTDPTRRSGPRSAGRALLTGIGLCGVCRAPVHAGGAARGVRGYRCSAGPGHVSRMAEPVEDYVQAVVVARLAEPDAAELLVDRHRPDVDALREQAVALRTRLDTVAVEFADGVLTSSQLRTITERTRARLAEVEAQMVDAGRADVLGPLVGADDVRAVWDALPLPRRRAVIETLMTVVLYPPGRGVRTFRPESVGIEWKAADQ